jgi:hypothetical protein
MDSRSPTRPSPNSKWKPGVTLAAAVLTVMGIAASGCLERGLKPVNPCTRSSVGQRIQVTNVDNVDLLFMIDNSNSMAEEQANLILELPRLVNVLASGDRDADGMRDFNPVKSLHVGIITSDMGAGPNTGVPTCARGLGDDGILRSRSRLTTAPCMATYPSAVFEFDRERGDNPNDFAATVGCVANIGTGGCGFEQQLEASLKALTPVSASAWTRPGYTPPRFVSADGIPDSTAGQADGPNMGFLRPNSALAVVLVTDEEDCSVRDYGLFVSGDPRFMSVPLNLRCNTFGDPAMGLIHPIDRYVNGFLGLRSDPGLLIFSGIIGIPPETESLAQAGNYSGILMNANMIPRPERDGNEPRALVLDDERRRVPADPHRADGRRPRGLGRIGLALLDLLVELPARHRRRSSRRSPTPSAAPASRARSTRRPTASVDCEVLRAPSRRRHAGRHLGLHGARGTQLRQSRHRGRRHHAPALPCDAGRSRGRPLERSGRLVLRRRVRRGRAIVR